jgi:hypothetical protein
MQNGPQWIYSCDIACFRDRYALRRSIISCENARDKKTIIVDGIISIRHTRIRESLARRNQILHFVPPRPKNRPNENVILARAYIFSRDVCAGNRAISEARNAKSRGDPVILESTAWNENSKMREKEERKRAHQIYLLLVIHDTLSTQYFTRREGSLSPLAAARSGAYACFWRLRRARITTFYLDRCETWRKHETPSISSCCR